MDVVKRNIACKVWVADLLKGNYMKGVEQFDSGYVLIKDQKVSRVNIVGTVVDKSLNENSISFNFDDGSGMIRLRAWNESVGLFSSLEIGDAVLAVGKVKEYNGFIYVTPEIIRKLDNPLWLKVRKLELVKMYGEVQRVETSDISTGEVVEEMNMSITEEKVEKSEGSREIVLSLIEQLDLGDGADFDEVVLKCGFSEARVLINELLLEGEVFELHKGKLRVID